MAKEDLNEVWLVYQTDPDTGIGHFVGHVFATKEAAKIWISCRTSDYDFYCERLEVED